MSNNGCTLEGDKLIIVLNLKSTERSKSGKSILLASSHGFIHLEGGIDASYNITKRV